jgi:hypothetical protein
MPEVVWTPTVQWGHGDVSGGAWNELPASTPVLLQSGVSRCGFIVEATLDEDLITATLAITVSRPVEGPPGQRTIEIGIVPEAVPVDYDASHLPFTRGELSVGFFSFPTPSISGSLHEFALDVALIQQVADLPGWTGRIAISLRAVAFTVRVHNLPALEIATEQEEEVPFPSEESFNLAWLDYAALAQDETRAVMAEAATYTPPAGAPVEVSIEFDAAAVQLTLEDGVAVQTIGPRASAKLSELPGGVATVGATLVVHRSLAGVVTDTPSYTVTEIEPDGHGMALLRLTRT